MSSSPGETDVESDAPAQPPPEPKPFVSPFAVKALKVCAGIGSCIAALVGPVLLIAAICRRIGGKD